MTQPTQRREPKSKTVDKHGKALAPWDTIDVAHPHLTQLSWFSVNVTGGWYYNGIVGV